MKLPQPCPRCGASIYNYLMRCHNCIYHRYRRTQIAEMADWTPDFDMTGVSISAPDRDNGSPKEGDKIARNPANHADRWLVSATYFAVNYEPCPLTKARRDATKGDDMTPTQQNILNLIIGFNASDFSGWFLPSEVMAFVDIESSFVTDAVHTDKPGLFSVGLMQVENTTAPEYGVSDPMLLKRPTVGLLTGMKVARAYWEQLTKALVREPYYEEWTAAYNEGVGNVLKGRTDDAYVNKWIRQQEFWASVAGVDPTC